MLARAVVGLVGLLIVGCALRAAAAYALLSNVETECDCRSTLADYDRVLQIWPYVPEAYLGRAHIYASEQHFVEAIPDLKRALALRPGYAEAHYLLGRAYYDADDSERAFAHTNLALSQEPDAKSYYLRGLLYYERDKLDLAEHDYNRAILLNSKYADAYYGRAFVYRDQGKIDLALADFTEAVTAEPEFAEGFYSRGLTYLQKKNDQEHALEDFNQALSLRPEYASVYTARAEIFYRKKDYRRALADINQALRIDPDFGDAYCHRGTVYLKTGDIDAAIRDMRRCVRDGSNASMRAVGRQALKTLGETP